MSKVFNDIKLSLAVLFLFKSLPMLGHNKNIERVDSIPNGIYFTDKAYENNYCIPMSDMYDEVVSQYGFDIKHLNNAFKTFKQQINEPIEKRFSDQVLHYFSTYGLESLGINGYVVIPNKVIELPENTTPLHVLVVDAISQEEIYNRTNDLITSGMALNAKTLDAIMTIIEYYNFKIDINQVKNKELKIKLYDYYKTVPEEPNEWLRYVVFKITGSSMIIKSDDMYHDIISKSYFQAFQDVVKGYFEQADLVKLSSIFLRNKKIFLAIKKGCPSCGSYINKLRKLAVHNHKPLKTKVLDRITYDNTIDIAEVEKELKNVTIYKKISLANALLYRRFNPEYITYLIRNGKGYVEEYKKKLSGFDNILQLIIDDICKTVRKNVEGKNFYIPSNVCYALPTSEKMFTGNIPYNSSIQLNNDAVVGVHWLNHTTGNVYKDRVDLDLHLNSKDYNIGWYSQFNDRNCKKEIVFSGDMTDAPHPIGATEAYYVSKNAKSDELLAVNLNNFTNNGPVEFKFIIDSPDKNIVSQDYLINSHTMNLCVNNTIDKTSMCLGFLDIKDDKKKFYFSGATMSSSIISRYDDIAKQAISSMRTKFDSCLKLEHILNVCGAVINDDTREYDVNLHLTQITKDTFLSILKES